MSAAPTPGPRPFVVVFDPTLTPGSSYVVRDRCGRDVPLIRRFLDGLAIRRLSPRTLRTYAFCLASAWQWIMESSRQLEDLDGSHLPEYVAFLHRIAGPDRPPAPRSINLRLTILRTFYEFCLGRPILEARYVSREPAALVRRAPTSSIGFPQRLARRRPAFRAKVPRTLPKSLTPAQVENFFSSLRTWRDLAIVSLMLFMGFRSCEVLHLTVDQVGLALDQVRVRGKGGKDRVLPLPSEARHAIVTYLSCERPTAASEELFLVLKGPSRGHPMTADGLRTIFRHHRKTSGVADAHPHRFRHTFASDMVRAGMSLPTLMRLMGHSHLDMTLRYVHVSDVDVREEFRKALARKNAETRT